MTTTPDRTPLPDTTYTTVITSSLGAPTAAPAAPRQERASERPTEARPVIDLSGRPSAGRDRQGARPVPPALLDPSAARSWRAATEVTVS